MKKLCLYIIIMLFLVGCGVNTSASKDIEPWNESDFQLFDKEGVQIELIEPIDYVRPDGSIYNPGYSLSLSQYERFYPGVKTSRGVAIGDDAYEAVCKYIIPKDALITNYHCYDAYYSKDIDLKTLLESTTQYRDDHRSLQIIIRMNDYTQIPEGEHEPGSPCDQMIIFYIRNNVIEDISMSFR